MTRSRWPRLLGQKPGEEVVCESTCMTREQAYVILTDLVRDVLGDDSVCIEDRTVAADVPGWDSLAQITVLAAVEIRFGIEIRAAEADRLANVGELVDLILYKAPSLRIA